MNNKVKPALIGGVLLGLLSAIPFVNFINVCCCFWAILGGLIASFIYIKNSPTPVSPSDGAIVGTLAGIIGAAIYIVIGIPINIALRGTMNEVFINIMERVNPAQVEMTRRIMEADVTVWSTIIQGIILAFLMIVFSIVGGLIAVPIFEKRKTTTAAPPPNFG